MNLKKMLLGLLLSVLAVSLFAYDGSVVGGPDGELSRKDFIESCSDGEQMYTIVATYAQGREILRFSNVNEDNMDEEDVALLNDVLAYIVDTYGVQNRQCYSHIVKRGDIDGGFDGWLVLSHYSASASDKWFNYIYYFALAD